MNVDVIFWRWRIQQWSEALLLWIVWHLPRYVIYWSAIRLMAHGTTGKFGNTTPSSLSVVDALDRWDDLGVA